MEPTEDEMTIYTPFEPFINSAYGVSRMTSFITKKYLKAASQLVQEINKGKKTWNNLFETVKFF
jgi:poly(A) polymerase Pap1